MDQLIKSFLIYLKENCILGKGISSFKFDDNKIIVFSKINNNEFYNFSIFENDIIIDGNAYPLQTSKEIVNRIKEHAKFDFFSLSERMFLDDIMRYQEIFILESKASNSSWTNKEYEDFLIVEDSMAKGHDSEDFNTAFGYYVFGFLQGINFKMGVELAFDSIGKLFKKNGDYEKAIVFFEKCLKWELSVFEDIFLYYHIGECNFYLDKFENAIDNYSKVLSKINNPNILYLRAEAFLKLGEFQKAKYDLVNIIKNTPFDYGLSAYDVMTNSDMNQFYIQNGEVELLHKAKELIAEIYLKNRDYEN